MRSTLHRFVTIALAALVAAATACEDAAELDAAEQQLASCPVGDVTTDTGPIYSYTHGGAAFRWQIVRRAGRTDVVYSNERTDGSFRASGTINRWSACPGPGEWIQVVNQATGQSQTCRHNCLANGKEEINCPTAQIVLTKTGNGQVCTDPDGPSRLPVYSQFCPDAPGIRTECVEHWQCDDQCTDESGSDPITYWRCLIGCRSSDPDDRCSGRDACAAPGDDSCFVWCNNGTGDTGYYCCVPAW